MRVALFGGGAREHALGWALTRSGAELIVVSSNANPGLDRIARRAVRADPADATAAVAAAQREQVQLAVVGSEAPLAAGVTDALRGAGIPVVGPSRAAARIETSKRFCRELLAKHGIDAQPRYAAVSKPEEVAPAVAQFPSGFVVKPVGLTGGKGVRVQGADFATPAEGAAYATELLKRGGDGVVLEEKVEGEEFSLMALVSDSGLFPMPTVQDFKRALEGDRGRNTGGMGSYSQRDHLLPFLPPEQHERAVDVLRRTVEALRAEGMPYRGFLYGGFMMTARGPVLLEFNARLGDPEAMNVLALYEEGDFDELLLECANGRIDPDLVAFRLRATVVKYLVPPGYGADPKAGGVLTVDEPAIEATGVHLFYGSVEHAGPGRVRLSTSRGVALVGEASAIHEAGRRVDEALKFVRGDFYVRRDIGTKEDLARRTEHIRALLAPGAKPSPLPLSVAPANAPPSSAGTEAQLL
ncbi:MAG TPA: phosphoribosylamine--glycine ligase [Thermoplasmata archaeon]|nr:phosphoribosylamine--glycine ligase [Thermoplasmata archaeon]